MIHVKPVDIACLILILSAAAKTHDYSNVDDVVASLLKALTHTAPSGLFNIGSGVGHTLNGIVEIIEIWLERAVKVKYLPARNFDVPVNILNIPKA